MESSGGLPAINRISVWAPFGWLAGALRDLGRAWVPCLAYGLGLALVSIGLCYALYASNLALWGLALTLGFVFVAPMLAMGLYEAGRRLEQGQPVRLKDMLFLRSAFRQDTAYLGLALLLIYLLWGRFAQIVYGLSTFRIHRTLTDFFDFAVNTSDGHHMLTVGSLVGGAIAFFTYTLVVVSAPMLLDREANVFAATATSFRAVSDNMAPMILWAVLIAVLMVFAVATGFIGMIIVFPWLGLASWRAYRALVQQRPAAA